MGVIWGGRGIPPDFWKENIYLRKLVKIEMFRLLPWFVKIYKKVYQIDIFRSSTNHIKKHEGLGVNLRWMAKKGQKVIKNLFSEVSWKLFRRNRRNPDSLDKLFISGISPKKVDISWSTYMYMYVLVHVCPSLWTILAKGASIVYAISFSDLTEFL